MPLSSPLPIDDVLPEFLSVLETGNCAVLVAEPGAGKTTRVPLALLNAPWRGDGKILVLEPRRLAARAAARRMAAELGEQVGDTVGYRVRLESKVSQTTRIEVVTEGVFIRMILDDPELTGVSAVLFDEYHERALDTDLGLALALDVQSALRDDLRIVTMSATLDAKAVANLLGDASIIESEGRSFPVETRYIGRKPDQKIEQQLAQVIRLALAEETGSILVFLPGQAEIRRTVELLSRKLPPNCQLAPLYGGLDTKAQDAAIRPAPAGTRKIVLSSAIAQTSLTIEGVRVVIDSGLARVPRFEPQTGLTRLATVRASRASADQRRGRAGRTEPGVCYRIWSEAQTSALPAADTPEILEADLCGLMLDLAAWGTSDPSQLKFMDPPPEAAWAEARKLLSALEALDPVGRVTHEGKRLAALPLHPRLAHMVLKAAEADQACTATLLAALLSEPGLGGRSADIRARLRHLRDDTTPRARDAKNLSIRWCKLAGTRAGKLEPETAGILLALAYPDRVAQARGARGRYRLANGRGAELPPEDDLAGEPFLVVADIQGKAANGRIVLCAPVTLSEIEERFHNQITQKDVVQFGKDGGLKARRVRMYGALELHSKTLDTPSGDTIERALIEEIRRLGIDRLPWTKDQKRLRGRVAYVRSNDTRDLPDLSDAALQRSLDSWLLPFLAGKKSIAAVDPACLGNALAAMLPFEAVSILNEKAPEAFTAPTGTQAAIDYEGETGPTISIRVQELFGLDEHPSVCGGSVPLTLELLSPAHRPIQITKDLPGFWKGSWADVKADMKGRYPKHPWPDDPTAAQATRKTKYKRN
ncbi:ATP-dependent helicase HrpB [Roseibium hamelinense]|nr:ATP-dependent helicase HrpB [Roseibium hamelinense]MTI43950.1 ATP-dependent helicase HrpB [Roseibium hamelinense]